MSADNGIYILKTRKPLHNNDYEYRVKECCAIDNIDYYPRGSDKCDAMLVLYFGQSKSHSTLDAAMQEATRIYTELMNGPFPVCEYGISVINWADEFPTMTREEALALNP